jgi:hypothetical protein
MTTSNPVFSDIVALLNILYAGDPNIDNAPHGAFWQNTIRNSFVAIRTDDWGVPGTLVTPGNAETSNLYLALAGKNPFDGSILPQMPDTQADPDGRHATTTELQMVETWIKNSAPS